MGVTQAAPKRSTLAYANAHQPWELYQHVFFEVLGRCQALPGVGKKVPLQERLPSVAVIADGKCANVRVVRGFTFEPGTIAVADRGYVDFEWFGRLTARTVFFVTRPEAGMNLRVVEERPISDRTRVIADEVIELSSEQAQRDCPSRLRRVVVVREDTLEPFEVLTNNFELAARRSPPGTRTAGRFRVLRLCLPARWANLS